jgi:hypothetical protein
VFERLIELAIALGKKKMVLEVKERCGYPGVREEEEYARRNYDDCVWAFLEEAKQLTEERP